MIHTAHRCGLDWSGGGDECVASIWHGNKQIAIEVFPYDENTTQFIVYAIHLFNKYSIPPENVNADDGGIGKALTDQLHAQGWPVNRVLNQSPALVNRTQYGNRGAELWFNFAGFINNEEIILKPDQKQQDQLASRYYRQSGPQGKLYLESKKEARAKGHGSPDRADAAILAFAGLAPGCFLGYKEGTPQPLPIANDGDAANPFNTKARTIRDLVKLMHNLNFRDFTQGQNGSKLAYGSLQVAMRQQNEDTLKAMQEEGRRILENKKL